MSHSGILSLSREDIEVASQNDFKSSFFDNELDFVSFFPPELSEKLFTYLPMAAVLECAKCCKAWRRILNSNVQWQRLCSESGFLKPPGETETDPNKWNTVQSHVSPDTKFRFRVCPTFSLPPVASVDLEPLCDFGLYWRQCQHLKMNWTKGRYVIHKLDTPNDSGICLSGNCNGSLAALGSSIGYVLIWSLLGVPKLIHTIPPIRYQIEVEKVQLTKDFLVVLYQIGVIRIYTICHEKIKQNSDDGKRNGNPFELVAQIRIVGVSAHEHEYTLNTHDITEDLFNELDLGNVDDGDDDDDVEDWIRELFRDEPWFESEYAVSDMLMLTTNELLIMTGTSCNCCLIWELATGKLVRKIMLKPEFQVCYNMQITIDKLYLSSRKLINNNVFDPAFYILVFSLDGSTAVQEISTGSLVEDIQVEPGHQRMVWLTQESTIYIQKMEVGEETIIRKPSTSYVDNLLLHHDYIIFHEYDGLIVALNWNGDKLYQTMAHIGIVRGLRCYKDFLVSGGDVRQLCVWNVHDGTKLHEIYHQPCRIAFLFVDETKIITVGIEDPPVLIGYW